MIGEKRILEEFNQLTNLKVMVKAYAELSALRMKKAKDSVLFNRKFIGSIGQVFDEVRFSYLSKVNQLSRKTLFGKKQGITFLAHNGKKVAVFLSANSRLYGSLLKKVFDSFMSDVVKNGSEATIVGKVGLSMFKSSAPNRPYTFFEFPDNNIDHAAITSLVRHLVPYDEIRVFYGKYYDTGQPKPDALVLSSEIKRQETDQQEKTPYIFEPSLEEILKFFEKEIFGNLFEQAISESQLAKFASRLVAMNQAELNISSRIDALSFDRAILRRKKADSYQLNSLVSVVGRFA